MKKLKFKSLTMRIWTTFTIIILIIICSITIIYISIYKEIDDNSKLADLKVLHEGVINNGVDGPPFDGGFNKINSLRDNGYFVFSIDSNNKTHIINVNNANPMHPPGIPSLNNAQLENWLSTYATSTNMKAIKFEAKYKGMKYLFIISSIKYGGYNKSYLISYLPDPNDNLLIYTMLGIGVVFIAIGFLTAKIVANRISKPLKELESYSLRLAEKDWKASIEVNEEDEIGRLAKAMQHMQKQLMKADEEEKIFFQSISHDLKTPVMVIMSHADAIIDGVYIDSVENTAEIIRNEAIRLEKKIKQILFLNTLEYSLLNNAESSKIKLNEIVLHIVNRFEVIDSTKQWDLHMDKIEIDGNEDKIQVAIENILDNGLRYAKDKIKISLKKEGNEAVLEIFNDGPNIKEEHIEHIFDQMYKDKTGNFGLGLAISKKIIDFYKGDVAVYNKEEGVSFIIKFLCSK
jgi:two-component system sensor histidine kinase CssS